MDLLTQGLLGAAAAQCAAPRGEVRPAAAVGLVAGLVPDLDVLFRYSGDPLLFLDFHRHFTHALVSIPAMAALAAALAWPLVRKQLRPVRIYAYAILGCALAGVLDACTSYGTHLLWPFTERPLALSIVAIVDPVVTAVLLAGAALALRRRRPVPARLALTAVAAYLALGALQHQRAEEAVLALAESRGHAPERVVVKPTIANLLLWRGLYQAGEYVYADAFHLAPTGASRAYPGGWAKLIAPHEPLVAPDPAAPLTPELARFARFADGWVIRHPQRPEMIGDARFAMLPTSLEPLWGVAPDVSGDSRHPARFVTDRSLSAAGREAFVRMLLGR